MDKSKLLYRVFKEEGPALGMDMDEFFNKRRRGLIPFKNAKGEIEWLKRKEFRIAAAKKVDKSTLSKKVKKRHHSPHHGEDGIDLTNVFPTKEIKFVFIGIGSLLILYLILKLVEMIVL